MLETNRIYNMDCLEGIKKSRTGSVKLVATDPPYFQGFYAQRTKMARSTIWQSAARFSHSLRRNLHAYYPRTESFIFFAIGADMRFITRYLQTIYLCEI